MLGGARPAKGANGIDCRRRSLRSQRRWGARLPVPIQHSRTTGIKPNAYPVATLVCKCSHSAFCRHRLSLCAQRRSRWRWAPRVQIFAVADPFGIADTIHPIGGVVENGAASAHDFLFNVFILSWASHISFCESARKSGSGTTCAKNAGFRCTLHQSSTWRSD